MAKESPMLPTQNAPSRTTGASCAKATTAVAINKLAIGNFISLVGFLRSVHQLQHAFPALPNVGVILAIHQLLKRPDDVPVESIVRIAHALGQQIDRLGTHPRVAVRK